MKNLVKSMLLAALLVVGVSCEKQFEDIAEVQPENHAAADAVTSYEVSYEEALAKADALFAGIDGATTRAGSRRVKNHELFRSGNRFTRTASDDAEARFHIINYEDNAGFAMIAADKRATDIYAYSDTGNLDVDDAMENSGFGVFLEGAINLYGKEIDRPLIPADTTELGGGGGFIDLPGDKYGDIPYLGIEEIDGITYRVRLEMNKSISKKEPLVPVKWNQRHPYNYYCPSCSWIPDKEYFYKGKCAAGCGPVAAAQIMAYHKYPEKYATYLPDWNNQTLIYTEYTFDWDNMLQNFDMWDDNPDEDALMVARLIREIGRVAKADYGKETGVTLANMKKMFPKFGYNITGADYDVDKVKISLYNNRPVYARGQTKSGDGHAWVIDGYDHLATRKTYYYNYAPYNVCNIKDSDNRIYVHCNWGWGGDGENKNSDYSDKGYFLNDAFVVTVNDGEKDTDYSFTTKNKIIYNIYPKQ